jgi:nucleoside-diphosphate-sugar epimerase
MNKIVITGGLGFIFSHVTEFFLEGGNDVMVIDNLSTGSHPELVPEFKAMAAKYGSKFTFLEYDVSFTPVIPIITTFQPEYIIHAAAISDVDYSIKQPVKTIQSNNNATINVFEAARQLKNLKKLLYVSTDEVYGECHHPKREDEIIFPKNPYALSKAFGSILRLAYDNTYPELKDKTVETRFCNVFGPRQDDRKIIPAIKRALDGGKPVTLHNGGDGYRQYIHVSEIPAIVAMILERGDRTYNVTTNEGMTVNELIWHAEKITGKKVATVPGKRSGMDIKYQMDGTRLRHELGHTPTAKFIEHFKAYLES